MKLFYADATHAGLICVREQIRVTLKMLHGFWETKIENFNVMCKGFTALPSEIDCNQAMRLPPVASAVILKAKSFW
jgi:hypothetical protein